MGSPYSGQEYGADNSLMYELLMAMGGGSDFNPGANVSKLDALRRSQQAQSGMNLGQAERTMGHHNSARGGHQGSGMSGGYGSGLIGKAQARFEDDLNFKRDLRRERERMNLEAYFHNKELGDRMNMIQNFFGRNPKGFNRRETSTTQQIVNNAGSWEPRPITSTTETDMTMDILSQLLRG